MQFCLRKHGSWKIVLDAARSIDRYNKATKQQEGSTVFIEILIVIL